MGKSNSRIKLAMIGETQFIVGLYLTVAVMLITLLSAVNKSIYVGLSDKWKLYSQCVPIQSCNWPNFFL